MYKTTFERHSKKKNQKLSINEDFFSTYEKCLYLCKYFEFRKTKHITLFTRQNTTTYVKIKQIDDFDPKSHGNCTAQVRGVQPEIGPFAVKLLRVLDRVYTVGGAVGCPCLSAFARCSQQSVGSFCKWVTYTRETKILLCKSFTLWRERIWECNDFGIGYALFYGEKK